MAVGRRARARRVALGYELQDVAQHMAVTPARLHKIEAGTGRLSAHSLAMLSAALGVSPAWFFEGIPDYQRPARLAYRIPLPTAPACSQSLQLIRAFTRVRQPAARTAILELLSAMAE